MFDENIRVTKTVDRLAAARAVLLQTGKSPRELGRDSLLKVIEFVYRFGYTSSDNINQLLERTKGGYALRLVKQGYFVATRTLSGRPEFIYTLSEMGIQEAVRHSSTLYRYSEKDPYKINQQFIRHNLLVQKLTVNAINARVIDDYQTERMFDEAGDKLGIKRPDSVWITNNNIQIAVEVELTPKWARDLDGFILAIITSLESTQKRAARFNRFILCSDSRAIIDNYSIAMQPNVPLKLWEKNQRGHWVVVSTISIPSWLIEKIDFKLLEK
jgi:hypothetical protein